MSLLRRLHTSEAGTVIPAFLTLSLVTVVMGVVYFQVGRATDLGAEAQTGADGAALAASTNLRQQAMRHIVQCASSVGACPPWIANFGEARGAAEVYAARNGTYITRASGRQPVIASYVYEATYYVEVTTVDGVDPAGYVDGPDRPDGSLLVGDGTQGVQDATAHMGTGQYGTGGVLGDVTGFTVLDGGVYPYDPRSQRSGGCGLSEGQLVELALEAGVSETFARTESVLSRYEACDGGTGGIAVSGLARPMQVALLKLEAAMGLPLNLVSAYRSAEAQALVCARVTGPCAAPGRSMHQTGLAVDVASVGDGSLTAAELAINLDPTIGLCQPLPTNDANHLVHISGRECGGRTGTLDDRVPAAGPVSQDDVTRFAQSASSSSLSGFLSIRLVD